MGNFFYFDDKTNQEQAIAESKVLLYTTDENDVHISVAYYDETFWLTQKAMAELFDVDTRTISYHISEIYKSEELEASSTNQIFRIVQNEGNRTVRRDVVFYNLDVIIAVGYRVNSKRATQFRRWSTNTLKEYIIKGFVLNDKMLKNGKPFGKDYFDELLERIKEIRASERRFYQKITDIYSQCSYDYDPHSETTKNFFATVQNKLLFAVSGKTAPELLSERADSNKEHMGLTTWKNAPDGKILKSDIMVSKNYLEQEEMSSLNNIVNMYLDYAENQAKRNKLMSMSDWVKRLDAFLEFNEYDVLTNAGKVSRAVAERLVNTEFDKFRVQQDKDYISDFDEATRRLIEKKNI